MPNRRIVKDDKGRLLDAEPKDCWRRRREASGCRTEGSLETKKGGFWIPNQRILGDDEGRFLDAEPGSSVCFEQVVDRIYFFVLSWFLLFLLKIELLAS